MSLKLFILAAFALATAHGHGYLKSPVARTAIHLHPEFNTEQPYQWNYQGVECGGQDPNYSSCARCGGPAGDTSASQGGIYDKGVIVATYQSGAVVEMVSEFQAAHRGHFEIELCPQAQETDGCFQKLIILEATEEIRDQNRVCIPYDNNAPGPIRAQVWLPAGVRCERCTIRWTYRTSYPGHCGTSDFCDNPCPAQVFRNCADVKIV